MITPKYIMKKILFLLVNLIYFLDNKHNKISLINLDTILGNSIKYKDKEKIIKKSYLNLIYNLHEFVDNPKLDLIELSAKVKETNNKVIINALKTDRKIIFITAHYGNWELITSYISLKYKKITVVGRKLNNHLFNQYLVSSRNKHNCEMLDKNNAARGMLRALKNNRALGLVIDQHSSEGIEVNFLNNQVKMVTSTSKLAINQDALIIPLFVKTIGFGKYNIIFSESIDHRELTDFKDYDDKIKKLTQIQADSMNEIILKDLGNYFLQHRLFKDKINY
jgi:KDO2-lipid IV(A) lauroyltransferase